MSKKSKRFDELDDGDGQSPSLSLNKAAGDLYKLPDKGKGKEALRHIPIHQTLPDPAQPRRVWPSQIRASAESIEHGLQLWIERASEERGSPFPTVELLEEGLSSSGLEEFEAVGSLDAKLFDLVALAASIKRDGLTNAITVQEKRILHGKTSKTEYWIETGERRWLAYNLLYLIYQDNKWSEIPARIVPEVNVWRQAAENNARNNLNAIGIARQIAVLLMDLLGTEQFISFEQTLANGENEQSYYGQVADGGQFRIPRGRGQDILQALGVKSTALLRQYRALLRLDPEIWIMADDFDWPLGRIQELLQQAEGDSDQLAELAVLESTGQRHTVRNLTVTKDSAEKQAVLDDDIPASTAPLQSKKIKQGKSAKQDSKPVQINIFDWLKAIDRKFRQQELEAGNQQMGSLNSDGKPMNEVDRAYMNGYVDAIRKLRQIMDQEKSTLKID